MNQRQTGRMEHRGREPDGVGTRPSSCSVTYDPALGGLVHIDHVMAVCGSPK